MRGDETFQKAARFRQRPMTTQTSKKQGKGLCDVAGNLSMLTHKFHKGICVAVKGPKLNTQSEEEEEDILSTATTDRRHSIYVSIGLHKCKCS